MNAPIPHSLIAAALLIHLVVTAISAPRAHAFPRNSPLSYTASDKHSSQRRHVALYGQQQPGGNPISSFIDAFTGKAAAEQRARERAETERRRQVVYSLEGDVDDDTALHEGGRTMQRELESCTSAADVLTAVTDVQHDSSFAPVSGDLLRLAWGRIEHLTPSLRAAAEVKTDPRLPLLVQQSVANSIANQDASIASALLSCLGKLRLRERELVPNVPSIMGAADLVAAQWDKMPVRALMDALRGLSQLGVATGPLLSQRIDADTNRRMRTFLSSAHLSLRDLADFLRYATVMRWEFDQLASPLLVAAARLLKRERKRGGRKGECHPHLASLLHGLARTKCHLAMGQSDDVRTAYEGVLTETATILRSDPTPMAAKDVARLLRGLAVLQEDSGQDESSDKEHQCLLMAVLQVAQKRLVISNGTQPIEPTVHVLSALQSFPRGQGGISDGRLAALTAHVHCHVKRLSLRQGGAILSALARLDVRDSELLSLLARRMEALIKTQTGRQKKGAVQQGHVSDPASPLLPSHSRPFDSEHGITSPIATAVWALGRLNYRDMALLETAASWSRVGYGGMSALEKSMMVWGFGQCGVRPEGLLVRLKREGEGWVSRLGDRELGMAAVGLAKIGFQSPSLLSAIARRAMSLCERGHLPPRQLTNILWSLGRLGVVHNPLMRAACQMLTSSPHLFQLQEGIGVLLALAWLDYCDENVAAVVAGEWERRVQQHDYEPQPIELTAFVWALGRLRPHQCIDSQELLTATLPFVIRQFAAFSLPQLCDYIWGIGRLLAGQTQPLTVLFQAIGEPLSSRLAQASLAVGVGDGYADMSLMDGRGEEREGGVGRETFRTGDLAKLTNTMARARVEGQHKLKEALLWHVSDASTVRQLDVVSLVDIAQSLSKLYAYSPTSHTPQQSDAARMQPILKPLMLIADEVTARVASLRTDNSDPELSQLTAEETLRKMSIVFWAFGRLRFHHAAFMEEFFALMLALVPWSTGRRRRKQSDRCLAPLAWTLSDHNLCQVWWAMGRLQMREERVLAVMREALLHRMRAAGGEGGVMRASHLAQVVVSIGQLRMPDDRKVLDDVRDHLVSSGRLATFPPRELSNLMGGLAAYNYNDPALLHAVQQRFAAAQHLFSQRDKIEMQNAFTRLNLPLPPLVPLSIPSPRPRPPDGRPYRGRGVLSTDEDFAERVKEEAAWRSGVHRGSRSKGVGELSRLQVQTRAAERLMEYLVGRPEGNEGDKGGAAQSANGHSSSFDVGVLVNGEGKGNGRHAGKRKRIRSEATRR
ncbi:unnamed protein product [Vitrella brassicaformis CCMP3155]|uniref:RAP domain-containing protein n=4 Tax=Vitrella brassicaformis TaxID=1169539 RepID=A0A0G4FBE2_VITBC|nr:unnamed protein product [Vitrella brassicaformis CCMP3155]|eukprot:CEM10216.1 unnamed protein product [Vitrella brassicaformis CCMP3155]